MNRSMLPAIILGGLLVLIMILLMVFGGGEAVQGTDRDRSPTGHWALYQLLRRYGYKPRPFRSTKSAESDHIYMLSGSDITDSNGLFSQLFYGEGPHRKILIVGYPESYEADLVFRMAHRTDTGRLVYKKRTPVLKGPGSYSLGRRGEIRVTLETGRRSEVVRAALPVLEHLETENPQWQVTLKSGIPETHIMNFRPLRRGVYRFEFLDIHRKSPLGFFWFPQTDKPGFSIEVTPDVEAIRTFYHLIRRNRLTDLGYHPLSLTGDGMELHHLREYRLDEDSRHID